MKLLAGIVLAALSMVGLVQQKTSVTPPTVVFPKPLLLAPGIPALYAKTARKSSEALNPSSHLIATGRILGTSTQKTTASTNTGITSEELNRKITDLQNRLTYFIAATTVGTVLGPGQYSTGGLTNNIALTSRVDNLNGTTLTNVIVNGIQGLTAGNIPDLSAQYLPLSGGTITGGLTVTGAFSGGSLSLNTASSTNSLSTNATTTNLFASSLIAQQATTTRLAILSIASALLKTNANGSVVPATAGTDYLNTAVTSIGPFGQLQSGASQTLATSTSSLNGLTAGLTITGSGNTLTFTPTLTGILSYQGGGTGISAPTAAGVVLGNYSGTGYQQLATSSLGLLTSSVAEGGNLYFTNARAQAALAVAGLPLTYNAGVIGINQATLLQNGYLSSTDFTTFNNKISSTSLSGGFGISYNPATGVFANTGATSVSNADGTLTITPTSGSVVASLNLINANTWSGPQTFANLIATNATTSNFVAANATSTTLFSTLANFGFALASTLTASVANIAGLIATNATTTSFFATTASTTSLFAGSGSFGSLAGAAFSALTSNFLPKWNGGTWANSLLYDNGTNVGIGTSSPSQAFSVNGNGYISGNLSAGSITADTSAAVVTAQQTARSLAARFADAPSVKDYNGIDCTGLTDSTTGFQYALTHSPGALRIPASCTLVVGGINLPASIVLLGDGPTSIIKQKASATTHMLAENNTGAFIGLLHLTLDGNYQNNGGDNNQSWGTFRMYAGGASATRPATVVIDDVTFANGGAFDTSTFYATTPYYTDWFETNTRHYGGADGYEAGGFAGNVNAVLANVIIDPQRLPTSITAVGRAGYIFFKNAATDTTYNGVTASNFQCYNTGISASATLGCLDSYNGGDHFIIANSFSKNAIGRGFTWKPDSRNITLSNVIVSNLAGNVNNPSGNSINAAFGMNSGTITSVGSDMLMTGVQCINSGSDCITFNAPNVLGNPSAVFTNALITNFVIDGCGSGRNGIYFNDATNLKISNGIIRGCDVPIKGTSDGVLTNGPVQITEVKIYGAGTPSFDATTKASNLWFARNLMDTGWASSDLTLSVSSNAITVWNPVALVNTASSAQTINTISNVPDGETVTVMPSSSAHTLTLATGGNLNIPANITLNFASSSVQFRSVTGALYPISSFAQDFYFNGTSLSIGAGNVTSYTNYSSGRGYLGFHSSGYETLQGGLTEGIKFNVNNSTFGGDVPVDVEIEGQALLTLSL